MPPLSRRSKALLAGLAGLTLAGILVARNPGPPAEPALVPVTHARLLAADSAPGDWLGYGRDYGNRRYSPLAQIDRRNVGQLRRLWHHQRYRLPLRPDRSETTPLALDGMLIYSDPRNVVIALDARTGQLRWRYAHKTGPLAVCCLVNRGLAAYGDKVYLATLDAHLVALDRKTGARRWDRKVAEPAQGYSFTSAPLAAQDRILVGGAGGDFGARGFLDAYDPETGTRLWRFWTVPSPEDGGWWGRWAPTTPHGESLHRDIPAERRDSARYAEAWRRGGASVWTTPAFDPERGLVIFTTGNPAWVDGMTPPGDNLYSTSIVAVDIAGGGLRWYYQMVPHNIWDYDAANPPVLFDLVRAGDTLPLVAHAGKTGWVYLVDRRSGAPFLRSDPLVPLENVFPPATVAGVRTSPGERGGANWPPSAFSPATGLLYVQVSDGPSVFAIDTGAAAIPGARLPALAKFRPAEPETERGNLSAVDPATGRVRWQRMTGGNMVHGGVLATGGGLVFFTELDGHLTALDQETGALLWRYRVDNRVLGSPIAFAVDGEERIAVASNDGLSVFGLPPVRPRSAAGCRWRTPAPSGARSAAAPRR